MHEASSAKLGLRPNYRCSYQAGRQGDEDDCRGRVRSRESRSQLGRLTLMAPDIVSAILSGKHPPELTARKLLDDTRLPLDWNELRRSLGFA